MSARLKRTKKVKKTSVIPEHKKHQPGLVCSLAVTLAIMTFVAGTAIGAFMVAQTMRAEERQNKEAVLFIQKDNDVDAPTRVIYRNGLIAEYYEDDRPAKKAILLDEDLNNLEKYIDAIESSRLVKETTGYDYGYSMFRVFSAKLNRWIAISEYRGFDKVWSNSKAAEDLIDPIEDLLDKYLFSDEF